MLIQKDVKYKQISAGSGGTNSLTENKRNTNMDLVRVFAVFSIFSMHFFIHSGFYERELGGIGGYFTMAMKTFFYDLRSVIYYSFGVSNE